MPKALHVKQKSQVKDFKIDSTIQYRLCVNLLVLKTILS